MNLDRKITYVVLLFFVGVFYLSPFPSLAITIPSNPTEPSNKNLLASLYQSFTQTALIQTIADAITPFVSTPYVYQPTTTHSSSQKQNPTYVPLQQSSQNQQNTSTTSANPSPASSISSSPAFYSNTTQTGYTPPPSYTAQTNTATNQNYITRQEFEQRLSQLSSALSSITIPTITTPPPSQPSNNIYQVIAQSSRIDQLSGTSISNPTITGGTITNSTINSPSLNVSGSTNLSTTSVTDLLVSGNVGVGTTSPYMKLSVVGDESVSGSLRLGNGKAWGWWPGVALAVDENFNENPINSSLNGLTGFNSTIHLPINSTASHPAGFGVESFIETDANDSTNWNVLEQFGGYIDHAGSGTVNNARAMDAQVYIDGSGNITNAYAVQAALWDFGSGSYTNAYGVYIDNNNVSATNQYGLFVTGENKNYFSGNVGIGTTSPVDKLNIAGTTGTLFGLFSSTGSRYAGWSINTGSVNSTLTTNNLTIDNGIAGAAGTYLQFNGNNLTVGANGVLQVGTGVSVSSVLFSTGSGDISFQTNGGTDRMVIKQSSGNVGIGTTSPTSVLMVAGATTNYNSENGTIRIINSSDPTKKFSFGIDTTLGTNGSAYIQAVRSGYAQLPLLLNPNGGNVGVGTTTPTLGRLVVEPGAYVSAGGVWTNASDRNQKENFTQVSPEETLTKINQLSITQWNYKTEDKSIKHIGPVAQDFYSIFGLGNNDTSISTIDPAGVALLGIQALSKRIDSLFSTSTSTSSPLSLIAMGGKDIIDSLGYYSGQIVDGVIHFAKVTVDTLTAKSGVFEKVCIKKSDGTPVCLTGDELSNVLEKTNVSVSGQSGGGASTISDSGSSAQTDNTADTATSTPEVISTETATSTTPTDSSLSTTRVDQSISTTTASTTSSD